MRGLCDCRRSEAKIVLHCLVEHEDARTDDEHCINERLRMFGIRKDMVRNKYIL